MADNGVPMRNEIVQGIVGGFITILIFVSIGAVIGRSIQLGHGDEHHAEDAHATEGADAKAADGEAKKEGEH